MPDYTIPGVYGEERAPSVPTMRNTVPLRGALIGKFAAGDLNKFVLSDAVKLSSVYGGLLPGSAAYHAAQFLAQGNRELYLCRVAGTAASISLGVGAGTATARVDGAWANGAGTGEAPTAGVIITVIPGAVDDTVNVAIVCVFKDGASTKVYTEAWDNLSAVAGSPRYLKTWLNAHSKLVTISGTVTAVPVADDYLLAGGVEPDYDDGIEALAAVRGNVCVFLDTEDDDVEAALALALNTRSGVFPDITTDASVAAISAPQYSELATITALAGATNDWRIAVAGVWKTMRDSVTNLSRDFSEAPVLAGVRCALRAWQSWTNKRAYGILGVERALSRADHASLIEAGVSTIDLWLDDTTRGWRVLSGVASDGSQFYVRVAKDWVAAVEISNSAWAVGENQGEADPDPLRTALRAQSEAFWSARRAERAIERFVAKCDAENNPPENVAEGICTKDVDVKLFRAADIIKVRIAAGTESVIARESA
jgi:hypothetical protein